MKNMFLSQFNFFHLNVHMLAEIFFSEKHEINLAITEDSILNVR